MSVERLPLTAVLAKLFFGHPDTHLKPTRTVPPCTFAPGRSAAPHVLLDSSITKGNLGREAPTCKSKHNVAFTTERW